MADFGQLISLLVLSIGGATCFFGYRLFRLLLGFYGFLVGGALASVVAIAFSGEVGLAVLAFIVGGVVGAVTSIAFYLAGVFLMGFLAGGALAALPALVSGDSPSLGIMAIFAFLGGILALALEKFWIILTTSFGGAFLVVLGFAGFATGLYAPRFDADVLFFQLETLLEAFFLRGAYGGPLAWLGIGILGVIVQYRHRPAASSGATVEEAKRSAASAAEAVAPVAAIVGASVPVLLSEGDGAPPAVVPTVPRVARSGEVREVLGAVLQTQVDVAYVRSQVRERALADRDKVERTVSESAARRSREVRDRFRRELEVLRTEVHGLSAPSGPALAPWRDDRWGALTEAEAGAAFAAVRIGDLNLFPTDADEDLLSVPLGVPISTIGAVVVAGGPVGTKRVRGAFLGWCVRLVAAAGPGRVAVAWYDDPEGADGVPGAWRAEESADGWAAYYRRLLEARRLDAVHQPADGDATNPRVVIVVVGAAAAAVADVGGLLTAEADDGAAFGVHLLLALRASVPAAFAPGVLYLSEIERSGRLRVEGADLGRAEVLLQDAPPVAALERVVAWTAARPFAMAPLAAVDDPKLGPPEALAPEAPPAGVPSAPQPSPRPVPKSTDARRPGPTEAPTHTSDAAVGGVSLERLLAAPTAVPAQVTIGLNANDRLLRVPASGRVLLEGGSAEQAAAVLAGYLIEVACQSPIEGFEFAVLDLGDDPAVADRFDQLVDVLPHLVDFAGGVGAVLALDDVVARIESDGAHDSTLFLFVVGTAAPAPASFATVLGAAADAGVVTFAWFPQRVLEVGDVGDRDVHVRLDAERTVVRVGPGAVQNVRLAPSIEPAAVASIADQIVQRRSR